MASPDSPPGFGMVSVSLSWSGQPILSEVDFHVAAGEIHALVGKQNEGKTTLSRIFAGELRPDTGAIAADGRMYRHLTPSLARRIGIEGVGSQAHAFPNLTIGENLCAGGQSWRKCLGLWRGKLERMRLWLDSYGIALPLGEPLKALRRTDWLFVELLNRLYRRPRLLLLDETLEQLRPERIREATLIIRDYLRRGMAVLWITHEIEDVLERADRVTVFRQGRGLFSDLTRNIDRISLLRLCYSELGEQVGEEVTREQFYELMNFMEAMLRDMPVAVIISDLERRVRFVNNSGREMFPGRSSVAGTSLSDFFGSGNRNLAELVDSVKDPAETRIWHNLQIKTGAGGDRLVDMRTRGIQERGVQIGRMTIIEDVTDREEMRQNLVLSENLASIGLLAAGVAHEVNDPLAIISNYLGFIRHESGDAQITSAATLAQEETVRIQQIVDNLVAFSGNRPPSDKAVDVLALARELCNLLRFHRPGRPVRFLCRGPENRFWVRSDPNEMRQVFLNLFRNSLDAIGDDGEIRVGATLERNGDGETRVKISVADNGCGIGLENTNDVFKPFITTKKGKGPHQGLGLSIVYGIVEKYGGRIQARNLPGRGCEFTLVFPLAKECPEE